MTGKKEKRTLLERYQPRLRQGSSSAKKWSECVSVCLGVWVMFRLGNKCRTFVQKKIFDQGFEYIYIYTRIGTKENAFS